MPNNGASISTGMARDKVRNTISYCTKELLLIF